MALFLIGAGFNIDAGSFRTPYGRDYKYPLMCDVARVCFDIEPSMIPQGKSIEDLFADAENRGDNLPMERLSDVLMNADHYLAGELAGASTLNCYSDFIGRFAGSHFLTFNYDSLLEILLFQRKEWFPDDGYGVSVQTELSIGNSLPVDRKSVSNVLALLNISAPTRFMFDPDCLTNDFSPYARFHSGLSYMKTHCRVIAPVPNKGSLLVQKFSQAIYEKACGLIGDSDKLVSIGYSFNDHDRASFDPLLHALSQTPNRQLVLISPDARESAKRITNFHPRLTVRAINKTFNEWLSAGCDC
ncbi:MAG: hypothetical protein ABR991_07545 [Terracidiphilus sp.]